MPGGCSPNTPSGPADLDDPASAFVRAVLANATERARRAWSPASGAA